MKEQFKNICCWSSLILSSWILCLILYFKYSSKFFLAYLIFIPLLSLIMFFSIWISIHCNKNKTKTKKYILKKYNDNGHLLVYVNLDNP